MREAILIALATALAGITKANGYTLDVKHISRQWKQVEDLAATQIPAILIIDDGPEDIIELSGDAADVEFNVSLIAYISDNENPSSALNEIDVAMKKAVAANETLAGLVTLMTVLPYNTRDVSTLPPWAWVDRPVKITYEGSFSAGL